MSMPAGQLEPIMTNSENIAQFGSNAYAKPATALNILRETVIGRPLFDYAFKEYARRWAFKHPAPADFFRTMEDASGVDLDWFWRGWFYDIQPVDISLDSVRAFTVGGEGTVELVAPVSIDPQEERPERTAVTDALYQIRNRQSGMRFLVDQDTTLRDFYYYYKPEKKAPFATPSSGTRRRTGPGLDKVPDTDLKKYAGNFYYELTFSNKGGLVMPVIIQWNYTDGSTETEYIHAYIWRKNEAQIKKTFLKSKEVASILIDPFKETADIDETNQSWPTLAHPSRFELYKSKNTARGSNNQGSPMQKALQPKN
jgi:hypothetical protein